MCPGGVKAVLSLMSLEVLSVMHIIDEYDRPTRPPLHCMCFCGLFWICIARDWATLGAIFTTTTRNLCVYDVIMKMVYSFYSGYLLPFIFFLAAVKSCVLIYGQSLEIGLINYRYNGPFYHHFWNKTDNVDFQFAMSECGRHPKPTIVRIDLS